MGRGKGRHSKNANRWRYGQRNVDVRDPLPIVLVVSDDTKTAVNYFEALAKEWKATVRIQVVGAPRHGATPAEVVRLAEEKRSELLGAKSHDKRHDRQAVWALIDMEAEPSKRTRAIEAKQACERQGNVKVALSDPCYEIWTLLHLKDMGRHFADCKAVANAVDQLWRAEFDQPFEKAKADVSQLVTIKMDDAVERARRQHTNDAPSWTELYLVIDDIRRFSNDGK